MVKELKIIIDENDFEKYKKSKSIISIIYIRVDNTNFPQTNWSDFTIVILLWWFQELFKMISSDISSKCELYFMDGPYKIEGEKIEENTIEFTFIDHDEIVLKEQFSIYQVFNEIKKTIELSLDVVSKKKWRTRDIRILKKLYNKVNKML